MKVTLSDGASETVTVASDYKVEPPLNSEDWLDIELEDGGQFIVPARLVVGVMVEGPA